MSTAQKVISILQVKSRNYADLYMWLLWYNNYILCDEIYICDDSSLFDISKLIQIVNPNNHYIKMNDLDISHENPSFNKQQKNINAIFKLANPSKNDIIIIPDDDEFWWYDTIKYSSFKECVNAFRIKLKNPQALYVPWTLMRSKEIMNNRDKTKCFAECFQYRTNIDNCEHKPILFFNGPIDTSFHCGYKNGKTITNETNLYFHSKCKYDLPLRLYHFRYTTKEEYESKRNGEISYKYIRPYMQDIFEKQIHNNINQNDKYEIKDLSVFNVYKNLISNNNF